MFSIAMGFVGWVYPAKEKAIIAGLISTTVCHSNMN
jgi:hypothetical protein